MKITKSQLQRIIRETIKEVEFHGETPEGELTGTEEEDVRFGQQLQAEKIMKRAGLDSNEMSFVFKAIDGGAEADQFLESPAYEKLLGYFMDTEEIPYGVAKAREGDPDSWILDYLAGNEKGASLAAEHKNRKITKTQLKQIIREELDSVLKNPTTPLQRDFMDLVNPMIDEYSGDELPAPIERLKEIVGASDWEALRGETTKLFQELNHWHQKRRTRVSKSVTDNFNWINTLLRKF